MFDRRLIWAPLMVGALVLSACASPEPSATATAGQQTKESSPATEAPASDSASPADAISEPAAPAPGAYEDYEDGVIEQTEGAKVLFFHAPWCPQCRKLDEQLRAEGAPDGLTVFKVDYDSRSDLRQKYGVTLQTTVVYVDDSGELISSTVLYDDPSIESLVAAAP